MKKRQIFSIFLFIVLGLAAFTGCEEIAQVQTPVNFASLRVANFNNTCDFPNVYDVYVYPVGQQPDLPVIRGGLGYGEVSPWIDNLATNRDAGLTYKVEVHYAGDFENKSILTKEITLKPGDRQTLWIFKQNDLSSIPAEFIGDNPGEVLLTRAYFRFINTDQDRKLTIRVNGANSYDNVLGDKENVDYKQYTPYEGFTSTTVDTSVTFFVLGEDGTVLGRLAGVALEGGTYKTITWGGACPPYLTQEDPNAVKPDSTRVRILNDAGDGGDETKVPPQTLRYFFVNALIPPLFDNVTNLVTYSQLGVVVNNDNRYNFGPLTPFSVGPAPVRTNQGVIEVIPTSTLLTDAINVKGYIYNAQSPKAGSLLFDYLAGPRSNIKSDQLVAFVLSDTVRKHTPGTKHPLDSAKGQFVIPIPDQPKKGEAIFVFLNMLAPPLRPPATANKVEFYINDEQVDRGLGNWNTKMDFTTSKPAGSKTIKVRVNADDAETYTHEPFDAADGGIYLVVAVGRRLSPREADKPQIMVIRTNPQY